MRPGEYVLDYGAGAGHLALPLQEAGVRVLCAEANPRLCEVLRGLGLETVHSVDGAIAERGFDVALAFAVLHHNPPKVARTIVANLLDRLAPGGTLLFTLPREERPTAFPPPVQPGSDSPADRGWLDLSQVPGSPQVVAQFRNCYRVTVR